MSGLGPCTTCGTPYDACEVSADDPEYTTDANGNHDGLCCEDCMHLSGRVMRPWTMVGGLFPLNDTPTPAMDDDVEPALKVGDLCPGWTAEPGHGVTVEDGNGRRWRRTDDDGHDGAANWEKVDVDWFEPESWTRVCEAGPVVVTGVDYD
jgi:hypothetical protein